METRGTIVGAGFACLLGGWCKYSDVDYIIQSLGFLLANARNFVPVFAVIGLITLIEVLWPGDRYSLKSRVSGLEFNFLATLLAGLMVYPVQAVSREVMNGPLFSLAFLPAPIAIVAVIVVTDFFKYWEHRFEHRFAWPIHAVHHSPTELHAANSFSHPFARTIEAVLISTPVALIDFGSVVTPYVIVLFLMFQVQVIHSSTRLHLGPLRWLFVDNVSHRYHHSDNPEHFDRNFGVLLSIWDRMFGTWHEPVKGEVLSFGVKEYPEPTTLAGFLMMPFRRLHPRSGQGEIRNMPDHFPSPIHAVEEADPVG